MENEILTNNDIDLIHSGLKILADYCDGAADIDGSGYNKMDSSFGHSLANQETITEKQAIAAVKMIRKYHRQLPDDMIKEFDRILRLLVVKELNGKSIFTKTLKNRKSIQVEEDDEEEEDIKSYFPKFNPPKEVSLEEQLETLLVLEIEMANQIEEENRIRIEKEEKEEKEKADLLKESQIELPNGKVITLNEQQLEALRDIRKFIQSKTEILYTLKGYAGTGKTTLIKEAIKDIRFGIAVSAPTHKAKKVIARAMGRPAVTIQSILGLMPNTDLENFNINKPQFDALRDPTITDYKIIIVDEGSMFNNDLFELLTNQAAISKVKIIFMGDSAQLPPVKETISPIFTSPKIDRSYQLTKVERQADGNPLMLVYDAIRNDISSPEDKFEHKTVLNSKGEGIIFYKNLEDFKTKVIEVFTSESYKQDRDHAKLVSWTNEQVRAWNKIIRGALFSNEEKNAIEIDDLLMSYNSVQGSYGQPLIENSSDFIVKYVKPYMNNWGVKGFHVSLQSIDGFNVNEDIFIVKPSMENYEVFMLEFNNRLEYAKKRRGSAWKDYYYYKERNLLMEDLRDSNKRLIVKKDFDYGYAITVHKSQGSTYNTIFVTENVIDNNPVHEERNKLKYVAFSRPTTLVVSLSGKTIEE